MRRKLLSELPARQRLDSPSLSLCMVLKLLENGFHSVPSSSQLPAAILCIAAKVVR